jgi:hypothetical protein
LLGDWDGDIIIYQPFIIIKKSSKNSPHFDHFGHFGPGESGTLDWFTANLLESRFTGLLLLSGAIYLSLFASLRARQRRDTTGDMGDRPGGFPKRKKNRLRSFGHIFGGGPGLCGKYQGQIRSWVVFGGPTNNQVLVIGYWSFVGFHLLGLSILRFNIGWSW